MISVCIPIYNFDVIPLLSELRSQAEELEHSVELLAIDDASSKDFRQKNSSITNYCSNYIELSNNVGRSAIRNMFLDIATNDYLIFLDCDGIIPSSTFLSNYVNIILKDSPDIVSGGRIYGEKPANKEKILRWTYGSKCEVRPSNIDPNRSFMTNNFLIKKSILKAHKFDESLTQYGHEDTLFSYELRKADITIVHVKNPVLDGDIEDAEVFIDKTKKGVANLYKISDSLGHPKDFIEMVSLLRTFGKTRAFHGIYTFFYSLIAPIIMKNLYSSKPSIFAFNLFKLNELIQVSKGNR